LNIILFCLNNLKFVEHKNHVFYLNYLSRAVHFAVPWTRSPRGDSTTPTPLAKLLILIENIYVVTVTYQPSKCHKIQSKVNAIGTFHLSSWCGSNLQQTKRLLSRTDGRQTDGRMDIIMFRVPLRNSVKMNFACCSFYAVLWPNVDALHLPFLYRVSPFLSPTFRRCYNAGTETPIM